MTHDQDVAAAPRASRLNTAGRYPPPRLTRWQVTCRYGLAVLNWLGVLCLAVLSSAAVSGQEPLLSGWRMVLDLILGVVALALVRLRRRHPLTVVLVLLAFSTVSASSGAVLAWALISLASRRRARPLLVSVGASVAATTVVVALELRRDWSWPVFGVMMMVSLLSLAVLVAIGLFVGARRDLAAEMQERADAAEREQELRVLQGQSAERNRIAREMHDVLAHRLSLVSMHAGVLAYREDLTPEQTREIAQTINENARLSLTELRGVLGSLREDGVPRTVERPQPQSFDVDTLVAEARAGGQRIDFTTSISNPELLPTLVARHAYRIVQEVLTNARKHAPGCRVSLEVGGRPGQGVTIYSSNPLTRAGSGLPGSQVGLVGVRERVDVTGGRMNVVHGADRFEIEVWLPW